MKTITVSKSTPGTKPIQLKVCDSFFTKLMGLMFSKELKLDEGIILAEHHESKINTSIHMLFMNYDLAVIWLDKDLCVVDKVLAKKWFPFYFPKTPAQYVLELHPAQFSMYSIGDRLIFSESV